MNRRDFLAASAAVTVSGGLHPRLAQAEPAAVRGKAEACIFVWLGPLSTQPIKYIIQQCLQRLHVARAARPPARTERSYSVVSTTHRGLLWLQ